MSTKKLFLIVSMFVICLISSRPSYGQLPQLTGNELSALAGAPIAERFGGSIVTKELLDIMQGDILPNAAALVSFSFTDGLRPKINRKEMLAFFQKTALDFLPPPRTEILDRLKVGETRDRLQNAISAFYREAMGSTGDGPVARRAYYAHLCLLDFAGLFIRKMSYAPGQDLDSIAGFSTDGGYNYLFAFLQFMGFFADSIGIGVNIVETGTPDISILLSMNDRIRYEYLLYNDVASRGISSGFRPGSEIVLSSKRSYDAVKQFFASIKEALRASVSVMPLRYDLAGQPGDGIILVVNRYIDTFGYTGFGGHIDAGWLLRNAVSSGGSSIIDVEGAIRLPFDP